MNINFLKKSSKFSRFFTFIANFDIYFLFFMLYYIHNKRKGVLKLKKLGTITISVFKNDDNHTDFRIEADNKDVLPVSYVIEDTLKLY